MSENIIQKKSYAFSVRIVKLYIFLKEEKKEYTLGKQILRSGTSVGANVEEAIGGISRKDFRNKLAISYKEARETQYWLNLLFDTDFISAEQHKSLSNDCQEILKILFSIIKSSK